MAQYESQELISLSDCGTTARPAGSLGRWTSLAVIWSIALIWITADFITKVWALETLAAGDIEVVPGILWFNLARNPGAAFSLLPGGRPLFIAMSVLLLGVGFWAPFALNLRRFSLGHLGLGLLVGGGAGNLIDRVFRDGLVVDFIDFRFWPIFNIADIGIVSGTILILWFLVRDLLRPGGAAS